MSALLKPVPGTIATETWEFFPCLVPPDLARAAGEVALRLVQDENLTYIYRLSSSRFILGTWPLGSGIESRSVFNPKVDRHLISPLTKLVEKVEEVGFSTVHTPRWESQPVLTYLEHGDFFQPHADLVNEDRLIVNLIGHRGLLLEETITGVTQYVDQCEGDAYVLHCSKDASVSPWHGVEAPTTPSLSIMFIRNN